MPVSYKGKKQAGVKGYEGKEGLRQVGVRSRSSKDMK